MHPDQQTRRAPLKSEAATGTTASGPLQRRLHGGSPHPAEIGAERTSHDPWIDAWDGDGLHVATLVLLDGSVIARLTCGEGDGTVIIGRSSQSDIRIQDAWVHRVHASIQWDTALRAHVISHAGGANGTYVNLERVTSSARLNDGARVRIGKTELVYRRVS
jgi:hypothetical protein